MTVQHRTYSLWLFVVLCALDVLFLALHFFIGQRWDFLNLDSEGNLPTYYQGCQLMTAGCIVFAQMLLLKRRKDSKNALALIPFCLGFMYLSWDEVSEFHEDAYDHLGPVVPGVGSYVQFWADWGFRWEEESEWLFVYSPVFIAAAAYFVFLFKRFSARGLPHSYLALFMAASLLFLLVPIVEFISTPIDAWSGGAYQFLVAIEEGIEMLGATLFIVFNALVLGDLLAGADSRDGKKAIPTRGPSSPPRQP